MQVNNKVTLFYKQIRIKTKQQNSSSDISPLQLDNHISTSPLLLMNGYFVQGFKALYTFSL